MLYATAPLGVAVPWAWISRVLSYHAPRQLRREREYCHLAAENLARSPGCGRCLSAGCARRGASVRLGPVRSGINVMSYRFVKT